MKNLTRNGVAKSLEYSTYTFTDIIGNDQVDYCFSSKLHLDNFEKLRQENYTMLYNYLYKRFKFKVDCKMLSDCNLYKKIEHRGFCIKINKKVYTCPDSITLGGELKMKKSLGEWQETLMTSSGEN